jgi:hypothetical protein
MELHIINSSLPSSSFGLVPKTTNVHLVRPVFVMLYSSREAKDDLHTQRSRNVVSIGGQF